MAAETGHHAGRVYTDQAGDEHWNGANQYDLAELAIAQQVTATAAAGAANVSNVTFQVKDARGNSLGRVFDLSIWLSDASTGAGLTAVTASGGVAVTAGTSLAVKVASKALEVLTDATGKATIAITDTGKTGFFPCSEVPGTGNITVGAQLITANYG